MDWSELQAFEEVLIRYGRGEATRDEVLALWKPPPPREGSPLDIDPGDVGEWEGEDVIAELLADGTLTDEQVDEVFGPSPEGGAMTGSEDEHTWKMGEFEKTVMQAESWQPSASHQLMEAGSWRLAAELVRRYPDDLFISLSFPIEGVPYDCIKLHRLDDDGVLLVNRNGTGSGLRKRGLEQDEDLWMGLLSEWLHTSDRVGMIRGVSHWFGLPPVSPVPPTTPRTLTYRVIAGFLAARAFDRSIWSVEGLRSSPYGWMFDGDLADFAGLEREIRGVDRARELLDHDHANVFILLRDGQPTAVFSTDGTVRTGARQRTTDLMEIYEIERDLDAVVARVSHLIRRDVDPTTNATVGLAKSASTEVLQPVSGTGIHHWVMPATAYLDAEGVAIYHEPGQHPDHSIAIVPGEPRCTRCDVAFPGTSPVCEAPAEAPFGHTWAMMLTLPMDGAEAEAWADEGTMPPVLPRSIALYCQLCGAESSVAPEECEERRILHGID